MAKMKYAKDDGVKEVFPLSREMSSNNDVSSEDTPANGGLRSVADDYKKKDGILNQFLFVVVSGGTERERCFFQELDEKESFRSLKVVFLSSERNAGGLTPKMMQRKWLDCIQNGFVERNGRQFKIESIDRVYMVTDVDHYEEELRDILKTRKDKEPQWIISNPDIEIWIYYCFRNTPREDLQLVIDAPQNKRSSLMKTINGTFNNGGGLDPRKAFAAITTGIKNASYFYQEDSLHFPDLLSTQMWFLAKDIYGVLGQEFINWNDERIRRINELISNLKESRNR